MYKIASYKTILNGTALALSCDRHKKGKIRGNALAQKQAQLIPCTVLFFDKGGKIQRAGCRLSDLSDL